MSVQCEKQEARPSPNSLIGVTTTSFMTLLHHDHGEPKTKSAHDAST
jgi:hypothetical protein